jgi:hypothetical protein
MTSARRGPRIARNMMAAKRKDLFGFERAKKTNRTARKGGSQKERNENKRSNFELSDWIKIACDEKQ